MYENIDSRRIYNVLQDTPHWVRFVDWLVSRGQMEGLAMTLLDAGRQSDAEELTAEFVRTNPNTRVATVSAAAAV